MCKINSKILVLYYTKVLYLQRTLKHTIMKKGQKLQYIGKGFLGFHPHFTEMIFLSRKGFDLEVYYNGDSIKGKMLVRESEVKEINE